MAAAGGRLSPSVPSKFQERGLSVAAFSRSYMACFDSGTLRYYIHHSLRQASRGWAFGCKDTSGFRIPFEVREVWESRGRGSPGDDKQPRPKSHIQPSPAAAAELVTLYTQDFKQKLSLPQYALNSKTYRTRWVRRLFAYHSLTPGSWMPLAGRTVWSLGEGDVRC